MRKIGFQQIMLIFHVLKLKQGSYKLFPRKATQVLQTFMRYINDIQQNIYLYSLTPLEIRNIKVCTSFLEV